MAPRRGWTVAAAAAAAAIVALVAATFAPAAGAGRAGPAASGGAGPPVSRAAAVATATATPTASTVAANASGALVPPPGTIPIPPGVQPGGVLMDQDGWLLSDAATGDILWGNPDADGSFRWIRWSRGAPAGRPTARGLAISHYDGELLVAGGSANGSGVAYALDLKVGRTLTKYVLAPGDPNSLVTTVSTTGRYVSVFGDAGARAFYTTPQSFIEPSRERTNVTRVGSSDRHQFNYTSPGVIYHGYGMTLDKWVYIVNPATGNVAQVSPFYRDDVRLKFFAGDAFVGGVTISQTRAASSDLVCRPGAGKVTAFPRESGPYGPAVSASAAYDVTTPGVSEPFVVTDDPWKRSEYVGNATDKTYGAYVLNRRVVGGGRADAPLPPATDGRAWSAPGPPLPPGATAEWSLVWVPPAVTAGWDRP